MGLFEQISDLLQKEGTVTEISEATGIPCPQVSRFRAGKRKPSFDTLVKFAETYGWVLVRESDLPKGHEARLKRLEEFATDMLGKLAKIVKDYDDDPPHNKNYDDDRR